MLSIIVKAMMLSPGMRVPCERLVKIRDKVADLPYQGNHWLGPRCALRSIAEDNEVICEDLLAFILYHRYENCKAALHASRLPQTERGTNMVTDPNLLYLRKK